MSEGIIISLEKMNKILEIDVERKVARIEPGVVVHELCKALAPHGLACGTLGTIDWQTMVGAVMTGTHGGSLTTPSMHSFMESYTLVKANGEIIKVSRDSDPTLFSAMAPSMGVFGVVVEAEVRCVPLVYLEASMIAMPFEELIPKFKDIMRSNKYARVVVYPSIGQATVWTAKPVARGEAVARGATKADEYVNFRNEEEKAWLEEFLKLSQEGLYKEADETLDKVRKSQLVRLKHYEGQYNHVLCKERNNGIPHADCEFAFDFEKAEEILTLVKKHQESNRIPYYNYEIRTTRADDAMISCCYQRDTMYIDFQAKASVSKKFFNTLSDLFAPFDYRKHWAKGLNHTHPDYLVEQLPMLGEFIDLMEKLDPEGKFRNSHAQSWFTRTREASKRLSERSTGYTSPMASPVANNRKLSSPIASKRRLLSNLATTGAGPREKGSLVKSRPSSTKEPERGSEVCAGLAAIKVRTYLTILTACLTGESFGFYLFFMAF